VHNLCLAVNCAILTKWMKCGRKASNHHHHFVPLSDSTFCALQVLGAEPGLSILHRDENAKSAFLSVKSPLCFVTVPGPRTMNQ